MSRSKPLAALFLAACAGGCASAPEYVTADYHYFQDDPAGVLAAYAPAVQDHEINSLVGIDKMLSAALAAGDWEEAERLAELASSRVNIFLAGEKGERDALSFFGREKDKPFKGEPYERAMVDFYLGLLRYRRGDFEGALNAFLSAMSKDRGIYRLPVEREKARQGSQNEQTVIYPADYATFAFLAADCCRRIDEPEEAARYLAEAKAMRPDLATLFDEAMSTANNVLAIIEAGRVPAKVKLGRRGEILGYRRTSGAALDAVRIDGQLLSFGLTDDLYVQATTLGGRSVDELNKVKADRQEVLHAAGMATAVAGGVIAAVGDSSGNSDLQAAGLIGLGVGIAAIIFAETAIDASADIRAWTTLPDQIYLAFGRASPGEHTVEIQAHGGYGDDQSQTWSRVEVPPDRPALLWFRLLPSRKGGDYTVRRVPPPPDLTQASRKETGT